MAVRGTVHMTTRLDDDKIILGNIYNRQPGKCYKVLNRRWQRSGQVPIINEYLHVADNIPQYIITTSIRHVEIRQGKNIKKPKSMIL